MGAHPNVGRYVRPPGYNHNIPNGFIDMNGNWFWSSSVYSHDGQGAYGFGGSLGYIDSGGRSFSGAVRCCAVGQAW